MSILGTRVLRTEDPRFLTGQSVYTADLVDARLADALHLVFVRSTAPSATVLEIDTAAARQMPGVRAIYTAEDLDLRLVPPALRPTATQMCRAPLASDTVRFVGDPVAVVLADTAAQAVDAAEQVVVDVDPLDAVTDPVAALAGVTLVFPEAGTNVTVRQGYEDAADPHLFDGCEVTLTQEIRNPRLAVVPLEGRAAAAVWGEDGRLTIWMPNQGAQSAKRELALMLGVPADQVRVITPDVGGAFGAKFGADPEYAVIAAAAQHLGRPVRWVETRSENMVAMTHGRGQIQTVTIGGARDGKIAAYRLDILQDAGAYPRSGAMLPMMTRMMAPGIYDIPHVESRSQSVVTNTTSIAAYRGAGRPEATAAIERAIDLFAAEIEMDPAEVRRRNMPAPDRFPFTTQTGQSYDSGNYEGALDLALAAARYDELRAEQRDRRTRGDTVQLGIGLSTYVEITFGADRENATVEVKPDGSAVVLTGTSPHGQGHATAWSMLVSDQTGIPMDRITVLHGDTDLIPVGGGTGGSRSLQLGGVAVQAATKELVEEAKRRAADRLEADVADLQIDARRSAVVVRGAPGAGVTLAALAEETPLSVHTVWNGEGQTFPFGAHVAVVEVDTETGNTRLRQLVSCDDAGRILNPMLAEGQRHGGMAQGASQALYEEFIYDEDGNPLTATLMDYPFPTAADLPSFDLVGQETETPLNPLGAKGIGEAGTIGATPAVQNAVIDALSHLGVRHIDIPTRPERVWRAIQEAARTLD